MIDRFQILKIVLFLGLLDTLSILLLIIFYLTGKSFLFMVNVNFIFIFILIIIGSLAKIKLNNYIIFFTVLVFASVIKLFLIIFDESDIKIYYIFTHFYSLLLVLFCFIFVSRFKQSDYKKVIYYLKTFSYYYLILASIFLLTYSILYFSGKIAYFGMGANLHLVVPFFIKKGFYLFLILSVIIILSGKRAVLVNFILQYLLFYLYHFRFKKIYIYMFFIFISFLIIYIYTETTLFYRFKGIFNVDFNDSYSTLVAFGGRFEELMGIYNFFENNVYKLFFGAKPGDYYYFILESVDYFGIISNTYNDPKNYTHVTVFSFLFRYGIFFTLSIVIYICYLVIKFFNPYNELYLVFIGILVSSFFGANLLTEPISWLLVAFFLKYKNKRRDYKC